MIEHRLIISNRQSRLPSHSLINSNAETPRSYTHTGNLDENTIDKIVNDHKSIVVNKNCIIKGNLNKCEKPVISREISRLNNQNVLRRSLEPLRLNNNLSEPDTSYENHSTLNYAKVTRTGFIPLCAETGFK